MGSQDETGYEILRSIRRIIRKTSEYSRQLSRGAGLTVPQLLCLKAIEEATSDAEVTVASISESVQLSPPTVSRILDRLEHAGYVVRERRSNDRRKVCLSLTSAGRDKLDDLPTPLHEQFLERLAKLEMNERLQLLASLRRVVEMMEASDIDAAPMLVLEPDVKSPPLG